MEIGGAVLGIVKHVLGVPGHGVADEGFMCWLVDVVVGGF